MAKFKNRPRAVAARRMSAKTRRRQDPPATVSPVWRPKWMLVAACALVVLAAAGLALRTHRVSPVPSVAPSAADIAGRCPTGPNDPGTVSCLQTGLEQVLHANGQAAAFATLDELVRLAPAAARHDHLLAHHLGRASFAWQGNATKALGACPPTMGSGCMHGVLEAYLGAVTNGPPSPPAALPPTLCDGVRPLTPHAVHECWHGIGHGLEMASSYDWHAALTRCAGSPDGESHVACASGVFMENVVGDPVTMAGGSSGDVAVMDDMPGMQMPATTPAATVAQRLDPADLLYPCDQLNATAELVGCWQVQPSAILALANGSYARVFQACGEAGPYAYACRIGVGQMAGARWRLAPQGNLTVCDATADRQWWQDCMVGAVQQVVDHDGAITGGLRLCANVPAVAQGACYGMVGTMQRAMQPDAAVRARACATAPQAYQALCAQGPDGSTNPGTTSAPTR